MDHRHTWLLFDCRPMKDAAHDVINRFEANELDLSETGRRLGALAETLPDLDSAEYRRQIERLLLTNNIHRARKLVDCLSDETLRPWVRLSATLGWFAVKWSAFFGAVALVVWLVMR